MGEYIKDNMILSGLSNFDRLANALDRQRQAGIFCDVLLKIDGNTLPAHSCVLSACSSYLQEIFTNDRPRVFSEGTPQIIEFPLTSENSSEDATAVFNSLVNLVEFFYGGILQVDDANCYNIAALASLLQVDDVTQRCKDFISTRNNDIEMEEGIEKENAENVLLEGELLNAKCECDKECGKIMEEEEPISNCKITNESTKLESADAEKNIEVSNNVEIRKQMYDFVQENTNETLVVTTSDEPSISLHSEKPVMGGKRVRKVKKPQTAVNRPKASKKSSQTKIVPTSVKVAKKGKQSKKSSAPETLENTIRKMFIKSKKGTKKDNGESNEMKCKKCSFSTRCNKAIEEHRLLHFGRPYTCKTCDLKVKKPANMLKHLMESSCTESKETACSICDEETLSIEKLKEHLKTHDHAKPFICTACEKRFPSKTALLLHHSKHSQQRPHVCDICDRRFKTKYSLNNHLIVHEDLKQYLCDECGYSTSYKASLEAHKLIHTGNTMKCPHVGCQFQAVRKSNLKEHLMTHNKEKGFQCEICGQPFSRSKNLRRHSFMHGGGDQVIHGCPMCDFMSNRRDKIKAHIKKQHSQVQNNSDLAVPEKFHKKLRALLEMASTENIPSPSPLKVEHHVFLMDADNLMLTPVSLTNDIPQQSTSFPITIQNVGDKSSSFIGVEVTEVKHCPVYSFDQMTIIE